MQHLLIVLFQRQTLFFPCLLPSLCQPYHPPAGNSHTTSPLGLTLLKVELQSTITAFRRLLKYVCVISDETFAQIPSEEVLGEHASGEGTLYGSLEELIT